MSTLKILKTIFISFGICYLGSIIQIFIPFLPAIISAFVLLFIFLSFNIVKAETIEPMEKTFVPILSILFVPSSVNIYAIWDKVSSQFITFVSFVVISFFIVFLVTFIVARILVFLLKIKGEED
jgi:holin-like protein